MGIRFYCPNGCKVHVKAFQAGRRGICPHCGVGVDIPLKSTRPASREKPIGKGIKAGPDALGMPHAGGLVSPSGNDEETELLSAGPLDGPIGSPRDVPPPLPPVTGSPSGGGVVSEPPPLVAEGNLPGVSHASASDGIPNRSGDTPVPPVGEMSSASTKTVRPGGASSIEPDIFQDAPDVIWYIRPPSGGQFGPASRDVMRAWLAEGRITPDSLVWREGWRDWKEAVEVFPEGAFPQLRIPDAIPGLDRMFDAAGAPASAGYPPVPAVRRTSLLRRVVLILLALGVAGGVLAAIYLLVSGRRFW